MIVLNSGMAVYFGALLLGVGFIIGAVFVLWSEGILRTAFSLEPQDGRRGS